MFYGRILPLRRTVLINGAHVKFGIGFTRLNSAFIKTV